MKRRMKWKCFMLAVVLLLETCAGNDLQAERKMAADFGMNIKKVYASQQLPNDKKQQSLKKAENIEESVQPAQTVTPSATEPATTEPSETEPAVTGPATTEPSATEPSVTEPATTEPAVTEPAKTATPPATRLLQRVQLPLLRFRYRQRWSILSRDAWQSFIFAEEDVTR